MDYHTPLLLDRILGSNSKEFDTRLVHSASLLLRVLLLLPQSPYHLLIIQFC